MSKRRARHAEVAALVRYYQARSYSRRAARRAAHVTMASRADFARWLDDWPRAKRVECVTCGELRYTVVGGGCAACRRLYG